jgi:hypothetical protein
VNGKTVTGTATSNDTFVAGAGGTSADNPTGMEVHVSCSDPFTGGWGVKAGPNQVTDSAWQIASYAIAKYKSGKIEKQCGATFVPVTRTVTDTDPVNYEANTPPPTTTPPTTPPPTTPPPTTPPPPVKGVIGDRAWFDTNANGVQDAGEPGLQFVGVTLLNADGSPARRNDGSAFPTQYTNSFGSYLFTEVPAGTYLVRFDTDCSFLPTTANVGDDAFDSDGVSSGQGGGRCLATAGAVTLPAGGANLTVDYGVISQTPPPPPPTTTTAPPITTAPPTTPPPPAKSSLGDRAWVDSNGNGIQDAGEPGLQWVGVTLLRSDGSPAIGNNGVPIPSQYTTSTGNYLFTEVPAGSYRIVFDTDCSFQPTVANAGSNDAVDSDAVPSGQVFGRCLATTGTIDVPAGTSNLTIDYGVVTQAPPPPPPPPDKKSSIGDRAWFDTNTNGIQDAGEPGLQWVGVTLLKSDGNPALDYLGNPVAKQFTDAGGNYLFTGLPAGTYVVRFDTDCAFAPTAANVGSNDAIDSDATASGQISGRCTATSGPITIPLGVTITTTDYGLVNATVPPPPPPPPPTATKMQGRAWFDTNNNGLQDSGEPSLQWVGVRITTADGNPVVDTNGQTVTKIYTDANGNYTFRNLPAGSYKVTFDVDEESFRFTVPNAGDDAIDSDASESGVDPEGTPFRRIYATSSTVNLTSGAAVIDVGVVTNPAKLYKK